MIVLRQMRPEDINFVHSSWLKSSRNDSPINSKVPSGIWSSNKGPSIKETIERSETLIASLPEDEAHIVGFITYELVGEVLIIHYVLVKKTYQGFGFARRLLDAVYEINEKNSVILSNLSRDFIVRFFNSGDKNRLYIYNPFIEEEMKQWPRLET